MEEGLVTFLKADSTFNTAVGGRLYPDVASPQATRPYVTYFKVSTVDPMQLSGAAGVPTARIQMDVIAATRSSARTVAGRMRTLLRGYRGTMGAYKVKQTVIEDWFSGYEPPADGSGVPDYVETLDVLITWDDP